MKRTCFFFNRIYFKSIFVLAIEFLLLFLAIYNKHHCISFYDTLICASMYANMGVYPIVSFYFIEHDRSMQNPSVILRYNNCKKIWKDKIYTVFKSSFIYSICVTIAATMIGVLISDRTCNWNDKESLFFKYNGFLSDTIPSIVRIITIVVLIFFINLLFIESLISLFNWISNNYWTGYIVVVLLYNIPRVPGFKYSLNDMSLLYSDFTNSIDFCTHVFRRIVILLVFSVFFVFIGHEYQNKEFY